MQSRSFPSTSSHFYHVCLKQFNYPIFCHRPLCYFRRIKNTLVFKLILKTTLGNGNCLGLVPSRILLPFRLLLCFVPINSTASELIICLATLNLSIAGCLLSNQKLYLLLLFICYCQTKKAAYLFLLQELCVPSAVKILLFSNFYLRALSHRQVLKSPVILF